MLIIRLQRVGRKNDPSFRVIVTDSKNSAKTGNFLEIVGNYDARHGQPEFKTERIQQWIKDGAQLSKTVHNLLVKNKIIDGQTINLVPTKTVKPETETVKETPVEVATPEVAPVAPKENETVAEEVVVSETVESAVETPEAVSEEETKTTEEAPAV